MSGDANIGIPFHQFYVIFAEQNGIDYLSKVSFPSLQETVLSDHESKESS
jgi:hypothetical protein